ncbi:MAG: DUF1622 domain-containing protein [Nodosilinea sp.]
MDWLEPLEHLLEDVVLIAKFCLEAISVLCVLAGLFKTVELAIGLNRQRQRREEFPYNQVRLKFGLWLAIALEFQLGADILATTVAPSSQDLTKLALIAIIRTFLNYFLGKEMADEIAMERERERNALAEGRVGG